jgi:hypothetical protein
MPIMIATLLMFVCKPGVISAFAAPQQQAHLSAQSFPAACFFFAPNKDHLSVEDKERTAKQSSYEASIAGIYRLWCKPNASSAQVKMNAADAMAASWKLLWDEGEPYNAVFHENGAIELLALMGITHQMPTPMVDDPKFTQMWIDGCNDTCFRISSDLEKPAGQHYIIMQLRLRNDVFDHLKKEPASEPVLQMLWDARFRLVD